MLKKSSQIQESENLSETKYTWKYNTLACVIRTLDDWMWTRRHLSKKNCYKGRGRVGYTGLSISSEVRSNFYMYHV